MNNTGITITVPHLFSPISAFSAESKSYILGLYIMHSITRIGKQKSNNFVFFGALPRSAGLCGEPGSLDYAFISNSGTARITQSGETADRLYLGEIAGTSGSGTYN